MTNPKKGDWIEINRRHPLSHGQRHQIAEFRDNGWVLTTKGALFHCDFFEPCSDILTSSPAWEDSPWQPSKLGEYRQLSLWKSTETPNRSYEPTSPISPSTSTSETTIPKGENLTSSPWDSPAPEPATPVTAVDSSTQPQPCGEKVSAVSSSVVPDSVLLNNLKGLSDEDFEPFWEDWQWQDTLLKLKSSRRRSSERGTADEDCCLFPTLTSGAQGLNSRPAGQTKCEKWFKDKGLIPPGSQLSAQAMALMMGFPESWLDCLSPPVIPDGSELDIWRDERLPQDKGRSLLGEFSTSTKLQGGEGIRWGEFSAPPCKRSKGKGTGYIECRRVKRNGKVYQQYWYHYEVWSGGDRLTKASKYIRKGAIAQIRELEERKAPVREILKVLGVVL